MLLQMKERKIRLFISSTFRDMNAERDYLNNYIFPQIREYCKARFIEFIPIDLRWGITEEESRNALVLASCLEQIDNSLPFFIGLVGLSYGTQPKPEELNCARPVITKNKEWLKKMIDQNASITEIEMEYAALSNQNKCRGVFFIKQDSAAVPENFKEVSGAKKHKLQKLRDKIQHQNIYPVYDYTDIEVMGQILLKELKKLIDKEYVPTATDYEMSIIGRHEASLERRAITYVHFPNVDRDIQCWKENAYPILLYTGPAGSGTSNYMSHLVTYFRSHFQSKVIYYDFECADVSIDPVDDFLAFMQLKQNTVNENEWSLIAIDNASLLDIEQTKRMGHWLRNKPQKMHVMLAASFSIFATEQKVKGADVITMNGLTHKMQYEYIQNFIKRYGKKLTQEQQDEIIRGKHSNDPTILEMLLQSLVNFGSIEKLDERIKRLTDESNFSLFWNMLVEGEKMFNEVGLYEEFISTLVTIAMHGNYGISEQDLMTMLNIPMSKWAVISPMIKSFCNGNPRKLIFTHPSLQNQDVKNHFDTPWIASIGVKAMEWWLKQEGRYKDMCTSMAEIFLYIWHLPMTEEQLTRTRELTLALMLAPESVLHISIRYQSLLWSLNSLNKYDFSYTPKIQIGKSLADLPPQQQEQYFIKLNHLAKTLNRAKDISWTYKQLIRLCDDDEKRRLYEASDLLAEGKTKQAISKVTDFLGRLSGDEMVVFQKCLLRAEAFSLEGELSNYASELNKIMKIASCNQLSDEMTQRYAEALTRYAYFSILRSYGSSSLQNITNFYNSIIRSNILQYITYTDSACYHFFMTQAILCLTEINWAKMQHSAEYALQSAYDAFGASSYQYGQANILWNFAYYKLNGMVYNDTFKNAKYNPPKYYSRDLEQFKENPKVYKAILAENRLYELLISQMP